MENDDEDDKSVDASVNNSEGEDYDDTEEQFEEAGEDEDIIQKDKEGEVEVEQPEQTEEIEIIEQKEEIVTGAILKNHLKKMSAPEYIVLMQTIAANVEENKVILSEEDKKLVLGKQKHSMSIAYKMVANRKKINFPYKIERFAQGLGSVLVDPKLLYTNKDLENTDLDCDPSELTFTESYFIGND